MTKNDFINAMQEYYDLKYREIDIKLLNELVLSKVPEDILENLFKAIILSCTKQYKQLPDISQIYELAIAVLDRKRERIEDERYNRIKQNEIELLEMKNE